MKPKPAIVYVPEEASLHVYRESLLDDNLILGLVEVLEGCPEGSMKLYVGGYENDERELYQIPRVIKFARRLFRRRLRVFDALRQGIGTNDNDRLFWGLIILGGRPFYFPTDHGPTVFLPFGEDYRKNDYSSPEQRKRLVCWDFLIQMIEMSTRLDRVVWFHDRMIKWHTENPQEVEQIGRQAAEQIGLDFDKIMQAFDERYRPRTLR